MKEITDDDFEAAYNDKHNKSIIKAATKKYSSILSEDIQASCGMHGLWRCMQNHDPSYGRKFTTSLYIHVDWECKRELSRYKKNSVSFLGEMDKEVSHTPASGEFFEIIEETGSGYEGNSQTVQRRRRRRWFWDCFRRRRGG